MASLEDTLQREARSTIDLVSIYLVDPKSPEGVHALQVIHVRAGLEEFEAGARLTRSDCPVERKAGARILAELGWQRGSFLEESVSILIEMLKDPCEEVVLSAGVALYHRRHPRAIPPLVALSNHPSADVRHGVVQGLLGHDDPRAISTLIELSRDADLDVRDWATFGIAQLSLIDSLEIRQALLDRTVDEDPEVRGEALMGLAQRQDPRVLPFVERELRGDFYGSWAVEAAELLGDPLLFPALQSLDGRLDQEDRESFGWKLEQALQACRPDK